MSIGPRFDPHTNTWIETHGRNVIGHCGECDWKVSIRYQKGKSAYHTCQALLDTHARTHYVSTVEIVVKPIGDEPDY